MDLDHRTLMPLSNEASALQSVEILFATRLGERVMLREFGAGLAELLGRRITPRLFAAFQILIAAAIDLWEPRFRVRRVVPGGSAEQIRLGQASVRIEVDWRPLGHKGDDRVESVRTFAIGLNGTQVTATW